jgi:hypothetical protein
MAALQASLKGKAPERRKTAAQKVTEKRRAAALRTSTGAAKKRAKRS